MNFSIIILFSSFFISLPTFAESSLNIDELADKANILRDQQKNVEALKCILIKS
jgi:hypothetical protein